MQSPARLFVLPIHTAVSSMCSLKPSIESPPLRGERQDPPLLWAARRGLQQSASCSPYIQRKILRDVNFLKPPSWLWSSLLRIRPQVQMLLSIVTILIFSTVTVAKRIHNPPHITSSKLPCSTSLQRSCDLKFLIRFLMENSSSAFGVSSCHLRTSSLNWRV